MRNLLTFPDSLLKNLNLDVVFVGRNIDIKLPSSFKIQGDLLDKCNQWDTCSITFGHPVPLLQEVL